MQEVKTPEALSVALPRYTAIGVLTIAIDISLLALYYLVAKVVAVSIGAGSHRDR